MEKVIVRYKLKPEKVKENEQLVKEVFAQLLLEQPENFSYDTYMLEDGVTFIHVARVESEGKNPLSGLTAFKYFQSGIKDRCEELPVVNHVTAIGSYSPQKSQKQEKIDK
jgi:hypothetical protein